MNTQEFKQLFDGLARSNGFEKAFGGWFKISSDCIIVLNLQKSNFGNYYELNIKIFIQKMFGNFYSRNKDLVKKQVGHIFTRQPDNFGEVLDLDVSMENEKRKELLENLFNEFIVPFTNKVLSRQGIIELAAKGQIFLLPAIKEVLKSAS